jgi:hypothetical protein
MQALLVSFYTFDKYYRKAAAEMLASCNRLNVDFAITSYPCSKSWVQTTRRKPRFILGMLDLYKRPLLWVDIDNKLMRVPNYLDQYSEDLVIGGIEKARVAKWMPQNARIDSSVIWINNTNGARRFLESWALACEQETVCGDHSLLTSLWSAAQTTGTTRLRITDRELCSSNRETCDFLYGYSKSRSKARELRASTLKLSSSTSSKEFLEAE